ncbi:MAG: YceH family protein [Dokdonella sp.]
MSESSPPEFHDAISDQTPAVVVLNEVQARILGCMMEKQATTPDAYPLTQNAVVVACNQKSSRDPVLELDPGEVGHSLRQLEGRGLVSVTMAARSMRYEHRFDGHYEVTPRQRALLAMLMLRGPQTVNELYTRCERLADFPDADEVRVQLERMAQRPVPLTTCLGHGSGQREDRHMHLLCGEEYANRRGETMTAPVRSSAPMATADAALIERVASLEQTVAALMDAIDELRTHRVPADADPR